MPVTSYTAVNSSGQVYDQNSRVFSLKNKPNWNDINNKPTLVEDGGTIAKLIVTDTLHLLTGKLQFTHGVKATGEIVGPSLMLDSVDRIKLVDGKFFVDGATSDSIKTNGGIVAARNVSAYSDVRLKQNIKPLIDGMGLCRNLNAYTYQFKSHPEINCVGVIAQEVQKVLPQLVESFDDTLTVNYSGLIPVLLDAIKTLDKRLTKLERA